MRTKRPFFSITNLKFEDAKDRFQIARVHPPFSTLLRTLFKARLVINLQYGIIQTFQILYCLSSYSSSAMLSQLTLLHKTN